jgi:opacity protein-like surface antigen
MFMLSLRRAIQIAFLAASSAAAQTSPVRDPAPSDSSEWVRRSAVNLSFVQSRPQGAFGHNVGIGYGVDGAYLLRIDGAGVWSLRANVGIISYGDESRRTALSEAVGGRVNVDVRTSNYLIPVSIGPQVAWQTGPVRPYANAGLGGLGFITESHVQGTSDVNAVASTTNHSSFAGSWVLGGGVYVPLSVRARQVQLDLGVQYFNGRNTRYLAPGSIIDLPGAQIAVTPLESATHTAIVRFGVRVQP